jgi:large subunit ribosomal protein L17
MRHKVHGRRLNRDTGHRNALRRNLIADLLCFEQITTTEAKARTIRPAAEKVITMAKRGIARPGEETTVHARRLVASRLPASRTIETEDGEFEEVDVVRKLFEEIAPRYANRPGGYTRMVKIGRRPGDNADMAVLMLVED